MNTKQIALRSFLHATGTFAYIFIVALVLSNGEAIFGKTENFLIPVFMLLLFVFSASITGALVLGKPILLYIEGLKKDAIMFFVSTLAWIACYVALSAIILVVI